MAAITDPDVISFLNDRGRPYAETILGLIQGIDLDTIRYTQTVAPAMAGNAGGDMIEDGSESDGRTQLSKAELAELGGALVAFAAAMTPAREAALVKAAVNIRYI